MGEPIGSGPDRQPPGSLILVRYAPILLYRQVLAPTDRLPFALYSATGLPMIVIIADIGVSSGLMASDRAAVLVSAGMISVLLFPILTSKIQQQ